MEDLDRGVVTLDQNETDEPRAWAMAPGVAEGLRHFQPEDKDASVWEVDEPERLAKVFRRHLEQARAARTAGELGLGELTPLDLALGFPRDCPSATATEGIRRRKRLW